MLKLSVMAMFCWRMIPSNSFPTLTVLTLQFIACYCTEKIHVKWYGILMNDCVCLASFHMTGAYVPLCLFTLHSLSAVFICMCVGTSKYILGKQRTKLLGNALIGSKCTFRERNTKALQVCIWIWEISRVKHGKAKDILLEDTLRGPTALMACSRESK